MKINLRHIITQMIKHSSIGLQIESVQNIVYQKQKPFTPDFLSANSTGPCFHVIPEETSSFLNASEL